MTHDKNPLEQAVDLAVFAPIGFALEARQLLPTFVERGRAQVNMAKVLGQFAVAHGQNTANHKLAKVQEQAEALMTEFGFVGGPSEPPNGSVGASAPTSTSAAPVEAPRPIRSSEAAAGLPIADYDSLAASQVIPRLAGLSAEELEAVHEYELTHRGRKTILGKIAQLGQE